MRWPGRVDSIDVSIGVPPLSISGTFTPTRAERLAAWELLVELASRTSVAPLRPAHGSTREALSSLYTLYGTTRDLLRKSGPDVGAGRSDGNLSLALIALRVLNDILRPTLSMWHPALEEHEAGRPAGVGKAAWERMWADNGACRADLNRVRVGVRAYIDTLARIAGTPEVADAVLPLAPALPVPRQRAATGLLAGVRPRRRMVRWVSVFEGVWIGVSKIRSKGSAHSSNAGPVLPDIDRSTSESFWFDYVADMGDAFDATMSVAWQLGRTGITLADDPNGELPALPNDGELPRGQLLVLGGDEVYPAASAKRYTNQLLAPYRVAFEGENTADTTVVAIPGNHDWMGGIDAFDNVFLTGNPFGAWKTEQTQRWFVARLPGGWWLWAIDTALDGKIGAEQAAHFAAAGRALDADDRVIVCTPVPVWQLRAKHPAEYAELRQTLTEWLGHKGTVPVFLSGDSHYFAIYESTDAKHPEWHITSGGGGAFLHPTHSLAEQVPYERGRAEFALRTRWPRPADSRAVSPNVSLLRDRQSLTVVPLVALLHGLFSWLVASRWLSWGGAHRPGSWPLPLGYTASTAPALILLAVVALVGRFTVTPNAHEQLVQKGAKRWGWAHGVLLGSLFWATTAGIHWAIDARLGWKGEDRFWLFALGSLLSGALVYGVFLRTIAWLCNRYRMNDNLAFAAAHSGRYKHFLRCRIDATGDLTVYAVGIDPIGKGWAKTLRSDKPVLPPPDPDGTPHLHYLWGHTFTRSG